MDASSRDEAPMLPATYLQSDNGGSSTRRGISSRTRSVSMPFATESPHPSEHQQNLVCFTGPLRTAKQNSQVQMSGPLYPNRNNELIFRPPQTAAEPENQARNDDGDYVGKNENLFSSGQLGKCSDPYCTACSIYYGQQNLSRTTEMFDAEYRNMLYGDAQSWAKRMRSCFLSYIPGVINPHAKLVQWWKKFFVICCIVASFLDPFFFFLFFVRKDYNCVELIWPITQEFLILRTIIDCVYFMHILLQFRLAYVAPETRVAGSGDLVDDPKMIAWNYFTTYFLVDLVVVLPMPQIILIFVLPHSASSPGKFALPLAILVQYIPRLCRFLPLVAGFSPTGFIFESDWENFLMNLLTYILASHVVGSCWYFLSIQRVNKCFEDACHGGNRTSNCTKFISCNHGYEKRFTPMPDWNDWKNNENQISTLAGNQEPSYMPLEVVFTMIIIGIGLLLFALLIGNIQTILQELGRRRLEKSLRGREVEQWMNHLRLPDNLRSQVRAAERFNWATGRGLNKDAMIENFPEDLQRNIRRHLFNLVKRLWIFKFLDEPVIDAIQEKLKTKSYITGSEILYPGGLVDKIVFITRGEMKSTREDGNDYYILSEGDVCGEELLTWCLEQNSLSKDGTSTRLTRPRLLSNRQVTCLTNVEAFVLRAVDFEEVVGLFTRYLKNPRIQSAIRYASRYWRERAARQIQIAWRHRRKQTNQVDSSRVSSSR